MENGIELSVIFTICNTLIDDCKLFYVPQNAQVRVVRIDMKKWCGA